jgi:Raf kinase inhibitor-like YbhB/YbcL family protein
MLEKLPESIGQALVDQRAGMEHVVYNQLHAERAVARMEVHSPAFVFNGRLPTRFTADGDGISPPLAWDAVPGSDSVVLIVEDADSPTPHPLVHAIVTGLPAAGGALTEGALASPGHAGTGIATGPNSFLQHAWLPPDPPRGHGEHRYVFQLFALRAGPQVDGLGRRSFIELILDRAIAVGCLIGTYEREARATIDADAQTGLIQDLG